MKIAVVTPVFQTRPLWLEQCLASVCAQAVARVHFLVVDGDAALTKRNFSGIEVIRLPKPHRDHGNAARAIGSVAAIADGCQAIAYLNAGDWFEPDHLRQLIELQQKTGAAVCSAARNLVDLDGRLLGRCPEMDGKNFLDTSCLYLTEAAFDLVPVWYRIPRHLSALGSRVLSQVIKAGTYARAHNPQPTVNFRSNFAGHYSYFGKAPPPGTKHLDVKVKPNGEFESVKVSVTKSTARVSLCMIVKNEEANLPSCLGPVRDLMHEIIVVDTGSSDGTKKCAQRLGAKVVDFPWVDSFAAARNEALRHATGDWIFWLDGDDRLDEQNLAKLRRLLAELPSENNAYMMCQLSAPDEVTGAHLAVDQARLFRNLPNLKWAYRVHEQIFIPLKKQGACEVRTDIDIQHLGYQDPEMRQRKRERNLRLLQMDLAERPKDGFVYFNLANATLDAGKAEEALGYMKGALEHTAKEASYLAKVYFMMAGACQLLGRPDEALGYCRAGKKRFPKAIELWFQEGVMLLAKDDLDGARAAFEKILEMPLQNNYVGADPDLVAGRTRHNLAFIYRRLDLKKKAEKQWCEIIAQTPRFEPAWLALAELYLDQKRRPDAEALLARLDGNPNRSTIGAALRARLALSKRDLAATRRILEQATQENPKSLWIRLMLADVLMRVAKDKEAAAAQLGAILKLSPNDQQARQKLAELARG